MAKIVIFEKWAVERTKWSSLIAIGDGLKAKEIKFDYYLPNCFRPERGEVPEADIIFSWGFNHFEIHEYYKGKAKIILVDRGFLRRDLDYRYIVRSNRLPQNCSPDRYKMLGISQVKSPGPKSSHVLICTQNHHKEWYQKAISNIHANIKPGRRIKVREFNSDVPFEKDLKGAHALVSYNSTCLYQAISQGIPVFCDPSCLASEVAEIDLSKIESPKIVDNTQFLNNLAYSQWTLEEMRRGDFVDYLLPEAKIMSESTAKPSSGDVLAQAINEQIASKPQVDKDIKLPIGK